jgi:meso-butanediol dehydrogenase/(S,S)-butanediol dehydrogenase/diacetyl reductase
MGQLLKGKTVIVTGAGGGTGFATATRAYDEGARVVATAHSEAGPHLLSDMSTAITGTAFVVDGGVLAGA